MSASGFRVRVACLVFVFKPALLVLKQVPTCIREPKTNTFDKSVKVLHLLFLVVLDGFKSFLDRFRTFQIVLGCFSLFFTLVSTSKLGIQQSCGNVISMKFQNNFIKISHRDGCSPVNLLHIFRAPFSKNIFERLILPFTNAHHGYLSTKFQIASKPNCRLYIDICRLKN